MRLVQVAYSLQVTCLLISVVGIYLRLIQVTLHCTGRHRTNNDFFTIIYIIGYSLAGKLVARGGCLCITVNLRTFANFKVFFHKYLKYCPESESDR